MSRLFWRGVVAGGCGRVAAGTVLLALLIANGTNATIARAAPKDKVRGSKKRAAETDKRAPETEQTDTGGVSKSVGPALPDGDARSDGTREPSALTLRDVLAFAKESRAALQDVKDYTAHFSKVEVVNGHKIQQEMEMKFRTKPFSVYLFYQSPADKQGRQAIFVEGRYGNALRVKEAQGLAALGGWVSLNLTDRLVRAENRHPVTEIGIAKMLETTIRQWEHELQVPGDEVDVQFFPNAKVKGVPCQAIQVTHLKQLRELEYSRNRIYFDRETKLPIRGERYGWPSRSGGEAPLLEDYRYTNLKTNVNLTDADFTPGR